jgi:hypothetical protein
MTPMIYDDADVMMCALTTLSRRTGRRLFALRRAPVANEFLEHTRYRERWRPDRRRHK